MRSDIHSVRQFKDLGGNFVGKNFIRVKPFLALSMASLICSVKDKRSSRTRPRCLVEDRLATGMLLKDKGG